MKRFVSIFIVLIFVVAGCKNEIGDDCGYDQDCSPNMDRNCDRSQPGGYCLIIGCSAEECPGEATCIEFTTPCPIGTSDEDCQIISPNRSRAYCLRKCNNDGDCRGGYMCATPEDLYATILDDDDAKVCVPDPDVQ